MRAAVGGLVLAALLALPVASAAPASGYFIVDGTLQLPPLSQVQGRPLALFLESRDFDGGAGLQQADKGPLPLSGLRLQASRLEMWVYTMVVDEVGVPDSRLGIGKPARPLSNQSYVLHNVSMALVNSTTPGFLGLDAAPNASEILLTLPDAIEIKGAEDTILAYGSSSDTMVPGAPSGVGGSSSRATPREDSQHHREIREPHFALAPKGEISFAGKGEMKLTGATVRVVSDERIMDVATGEFRDSGSPVRQIRYVWMVLTADDLRITLSSNDEPWAVTARALDADWGGTAVFAATAAYFESGENVYRQVSGDAILLEGSFSATLARLASQAGLFRMDVSGNLLTTNLAPSPLTSGAPVPATGPPSGLFLALLVGVVLGGAAGGGLLLLRHRKAKDDRPGKDAGTGALPLSSPELTAEYYVSLAEQALQFEDHVKALHWITLARETAPTSAHVATTMAYVLGELGHYDEALRVYEEASRLDPSDGEADLNAARLALLAGQPPEAVERLLLRALDRSPEFVVDVEDDPELRPLMDRPALRKALRGAWDRWGNGPAEPLR